MKREFMNLNIRSFLYVLSLFCSLFIVCIPCASYSASSGFFNEKIFNFGTILEGTEVPHDFILENHGDSILNVLNVKSNCGCAVVSFTKEIPPGGNGKISVVFDSKGSGGQDVEHKIRVETDDPKNNNYDLMVTGYVDPLLIIEPDVVVLSGKEGETLETIVLITHDRRQPVKVISAEAKKGNIAVLLTEVKDSGQSKYKVKVTSLKKEKGKFSDFISLKTDSDVYPNKQIKVKIEIN